MENRKKLCCTCGQVKPIEKFPQKVVGHRREAECETCIKNKPMVRQRPKIIGKSTRPPRLGKIHSADEEVTPKPPLTRKELADRKRANEIWENRLKSFAIDRGWFTIKEAEEEIMYSISIVRNILNILVKQGYLQKKTQNRSKLYKLHSHEVLDQKMEVAA